MHTYLGYAKSGREFEVEAALSDLGIPSWCGRVIESKRVGKKRWAEYFEFPKLPNYIFMDLTAHTFHEAAEVKHLFPFFTLVRSCKDGDCAGRARRIAEERKAAGEQPIEVPLCDCCNLRQFQRATEAAYEKADRDRERGKKIIAEFQPGDKVIATHGPFMDFLMRFRRVVEESDRISYETEFEIFGRPTTARVDPLDLRRA